MLKKVFQRFVRWLGYDLGITPNQITWGRLIIFIPGLLTWIYKNELAQWTGMPWQFFGVAALVVITIVIVFDIVDGALARETGQVTSHGKVLDPLVDKFITYSTLILFWSAIDKAGFLILFVLDITSTLLRGSQVQGANQFGKNKALAQNISKFFFATAVLTATPWLNHAGNFLIWLAVVLAAFSVGIRVLPEKMQDSIRVAIPQILTLGNLAAGTGAVWCALNNRIGTGVLLIFIAMACDLLDGAVARKLGVSSNFGKYFDTLADLVSFGAGPAFLVAAVNDFSPLSVGLGAVYFVATCMRLVDYGRTGDRTPAGFFRGFPSPAGAWLVVSSVLLGEPAISLLVLVIAAGLMCLFKIHWIHFGRVLPNMTAFEIAGCVVIGGGLAYAFTPAGAAAGPILLYIFSPAWRRPAAESG